MIVEGFEAEEIGPRHRVCKVSENCGFRVGHIKPGQNQLRQPIRGEPFLGAIAIERGKREHWQDSGILRLISIV
jgi:hypothetical protein